MNRESNTYTILYAVIMVVIVAVALAFTSQALKSRQSANEKIDKMQQILRAAGVDASDKKAVINIYNQTIVEEILVNAKGEVKASFTGDQIGKNNAFDMNAKNGFKSARDNDEEALPLYIANKNGSKLYIVPLSGNGLWGDIWGYIALEDDHNTVAGADFSHASETPGLGAEIATPHFTAQFPGKKIYNAEQQLVSLAVVKPGQKASDRDYVDGISGGTLTSNGVQEMLSNCLKHYEAYFAQQTAQTAMPEALPIEGEPTDNN